MRSIPILTALGSASQEGHLCGKTGMPGVTEHLCLPWSSEYQVFLLACPAASWLTLSLTPRAMSL